MKKRMTILLLPLLFAACMPQSMPPAATPTATPTEAPVTNGNALFEEEKLTVGNQIGSFTVTKVERNKNGKLVSAQFEGDLTISGEWIPDENGIYEADQNGRERKALLRCSRTSRDGLPKTAQDNTDDFTLLVSFSSFDVQASGSPVTVRVTNVTYKADADTHYSSSDVQNVRE